MSHEQKPRAAAKSGRRPHVEHRASVGRHFTGTCQWHSTPHPPRFPQPGRAGTHDAPLTILIRARRGTTQSLAVLTTPNSSRLKHRLERAQSRRPMRHGGDLGHWPRALPDLLHGHPEGQRGLGVPEAVGPRAPPRAGDYPPGLRAHSARLGRPRPSWRACRRRGTCAWQPSPPYAVPLRHGHHHSCGATRQLSSHRTGPTRPRRAPRRPHTAPACSGQQRLTAPRRAPCVTAPSTPAPKAGTVCHRPSAEPSRQCPALWLQP